MDLVITCAYKYVILNLWSGGDLPQIDLIVCVRGQERKRACGGVSLIAGLGKWPGTLIAFVVIMNA